MTNFGLMNYKEKVARGFLRKSTVSIYLSFFFSLSLPPDVNKAKEPWVLLAALFRMQWVVGLG